MKTIFDGKIEYFSSEELEIFVKEMNMKLSIDILESAIDYAVKSGVYNIDECYMIYNCLLKIKRNETSIIPTDNSIDNSDKNY